MGNGKQPGRRSKRRRASVHGSEQQSELIKSLSFYSRLSTQPCTAKNPKDRENPVPAIKRFNEVRGKKRPTWEHTRIILNSPYNYGSQQTTLGKGFWLSAWLS